jgi:type IV pilus assembly protein PilV
MNHDIRAAQRGGLLLEALIGILLFSIGILAVVALQASATKAVTEAKFRSDASFLADQLVGQIWANRANATTYAYVGGTAPPVLANWIGLVNARLPNSIVYPPAVKVTPTAYAGPPTYTANQVTISLFWQLPDEFNAVPRPPAHSLTFSTSIPCC